MYSGEYDVCDVILSVLFFVFILFLTALLNDVQTARVRTGLETHARHSPS
jgi:hypothetical protein